MCENSYISLFWWKGSYTVLNKSTLQMKFWLHRLKLCYSIVTFYMYNNVNPCIHIDTHTHIHTHYTYSMRSVCMIYIHALAHTHTVHIAIYTHTHTAGTLLHTHTHTHRQYNIIYAYNITNTLGNVQK